MNTVRWLSNDERGALEEALNEWEDRLWFRFPNRLYYGSREWVRMRFHHRMWLVRPVTS